MCPEKQHRNRCRSFVRAYSKYIGYFNSLIVKFVTSQISLIVIITMLFFILTTVHLLHSLTSYSGDMRHHSLVFIGKSLTFI